MLYAHFKLDAASITSFDHTEEEVNDILCVCFILMCSCCVHQLCKCILQCMCGVVKHLCLGGCVLGLGSIGCCVIFVVLSMTASYSV